MKIMPFRRTGAGTGTSSGRIDNGSSHGRNKRVLNLRFLRRSTKSIIAYKTLEKNILHSSTSKSEVHEKDHHQKGSAASTPSVVDSPKESFLAVRERTMTLDTEATLSSPQSLNNLTPTSTVASPSSPCPSPLVDDSTTPSSPAQNNVLWENENHTNNTNNIDALEGDVSKQEFVETPTKITFKPNHSVLLDKTNTHVLFEPASVSHGGRGIVTNDPRNVPDRENDAYHHQEDGVPKPVYFVEDQMLKKTLINLPPAIEPSDCLYAVDLPGGSSSDSGGSSSNGSEFDESLNSSASPITKIKVLLFNKLGLDWTDIQTDLFEIENRLVDYEKHEVDNEDSCIEAIESSTKKVVKLYEGHQSTNGRLSFDNRSFDLSTIMEEADEEEDVSVSSVSPHGLSMEKEIGDVFDLVGDKVSLCDGHISSEDSSDIQSDDLDVDEGKFRVSFVPSTEYINILQGYCEEDVDSQQGSGVSSLIDESVKKAIGKESIRLFSVVGGTGKKQSRVWMMFYRHLQFVVFIGIFVITVVASNSTALDQVFLNVRQIGFVNGESTNVGNDDPTASSSELFTVVHWDLKHTFGLYSLLYGAWVAVLNQNI